MTEHLRTPYGTRRFRPAQGVALFEAAQCGGGFFALSVGEGKTDISACLPTIFDSHRPLLIVPGKLKTSGKTERELNFLRSQWRMPGHIPIETYQRLSRDGQAGYLDDYKPDLVVCDESQKLKDLDGSAVAARINRYRQTEDGRRCKFVFLSGSPTLNGLKDFAHLFHWALGDDSPLPIIRDQYEAWGAVVDAKPAEDYDLSPIQGELGPCESIGEARALVCDRILSTPGVIVTQEAFPHPLDIQVLRYELPDNLQSLYPDLRNKWLTASGYALNDAKSEVWAHAMRYAVGLEHYWDPEPPREWLERRKAYGKVVRRNSKVGGIYDTEFQVRTAIERGELDAPEYWEWLEVRDQWVADPKKRMLSDVAVRVARDWLRGETRGCLIWVRHTELGSYLSRELRLPYFGEGGLNAEGQPIDTYLGGNAIASMACSEGFNLQGPPPATHFWRAYFAEYPNSAQQAEQAIGRIHRPGATLPVEIRFAFACLEHYYTLDSMIDKARYANEVLRLPQKLLTNTIHRGGWDHHLPAWQPKDSDE